MNYLTRASCLLLLAILPACCTDDSFEKRDDLIHPPERAASIHFSLPEIRGSAFILRDGIHFVTNLHVVFGQLHGIRVSQSGAGPVPAALVIKRDDLDLALFRSSKRLRVSDKPIEVCKPETGKAIYAIGSPYGLYDSLLRGYVNHPNRIGLDPFYPKVPMIQTQGVTYPGMSGAAVYCDSGGLLGINRAAFGNGIENGAGMIIPAAAVQELLKEAGLQSVFSNSF